MERVPDINQRNREYNESYIVVVKCMKKGTVDEAMNMEDQTSTCAPSRLLRLVFGPRFYPTSTTAEAVRLSKWQHTWT